ncbi:MAG TPA: protein translocase subunit SecF [Patescibacteria group bacterium]
MNIIKYKNWYFALSLLVIIPGIISLFLWGLNLSIDFTGGSRLTYSVNNVSDNKKIISVFEKDKIKIESTSQSSNNITLRTATLSQSQHTQLVGDLEKNVKGIKEQEFSTIGPTIGRETTLNALWGIGLASLLIVLYIAISFRGVPKPTNSWQFGICAIIALLHDALVLLGVFSLLGHFFGVEVDSLFVTAVLTVIGFSVHDTIVVFDRIRENLKVHAGSPFGEVVNASILQTMGRSLNTSLTVILVLFALLLFGGESTKWFVAALLVGIISGTYSSIFNASQLIVLWQEVRNKTK